MDPVDPLAAYEAKKTALAKSLRASGGPVRLGKSTSNLFRARKETQSRSLNVRSFCRVLRVDAENLTADVEGMTPYETLVAETLKHNLLPAVVPELKTITVGGALTGVGIESSSFRHGFVHETAVEMDILLPDGRIVLCRPDNEHRDLFFGFANSYGTFGYVLRARVRLARAGKFVELRHRKFAKEDAFLSELRRLCAGNREPGKWDFIEGVVFARDRHVITTARFTDHAPRTGDYKFMRRYYKSLETRETDFLTASDYVWRWDTDWFWCSRRMLMGNNFLRLLLGKWLLGSRNFWKLFNWYRRNDMERKLARFSAAARERQKWEPVIQDVEIPADHAAEFLEFYHREINILPAWVCPVQAAGTDTRFDLYEMKPGVLYLNFGFWDSVESKVKMPAGHYNRLLEEKVTALDGRKSLYSESFYPEEEFWRLYNGEAYRRLKAKYDPQGRLLNLYQKCVRSL